jgi:hypothetical protein
MVLTAAVRGFLLPPDGQRAGPVRRMALRRRHRPAGRIG